MTYKEMDTQHQKKINEFTSKNCIWDYSRKSLKEILKEHGWDENTKVMEFYGGIIKKESFAVFQKIQKDYIETLIEKMKEDKKFAVDAFETEMYNHEYCYNQDDTQIASIFNMTVQEIIDSGLSKSYMTAKKNCLKNSRY